VFRDSVAGPPIHHQHLRLQPVSGIWIGSARLDTADEGTSRALEQHPSPQITPFPAPNKNLPYASHRSLTALAVAVDGNGLDPTCSDGASTEKLPISWRHSFLLRRLGGCLPPSSRLSPTRRGGRRQSFPAIACCSSSGGSQRAAAPSRVSTTSLLAYCWPCTDAKTYNRDGGGTAVAAAAQMSSRSLYFVQVR